MDMRLAFLTAISLVFLCLTMDAQTSAELSDIWEKEHISRILPSNVRHRDLKTYLDELKAKGVRLAEVGRSYSQREIYQMEFGSGPLKVFLWSQMHGDEPTATSALIDLFSVLQTNRDKDWVRKIESAMTIRAVPMLNPDGSDAYIRRNMQGLDINRDARDLRSPEAQLLKKLREEWSPQIGFNLHNQNALTTVGQTNKQAAISFLVVYGDAARTPSEGQERNKRIVSAMVKAVEPFIQGHIGRYDDAFTPTAFGDNFSAWGTPVILIETGALHGRSEMFLVRMNFIAIGTALKVIADGSERTFDPGVYEDLPPNSSGRLMGVIFRGASILNPAKPLETSPRDIGANAERRRAEFSTPVVIRQIGELRETAGLEEYDASGFYAVGRFQPLTPGNFAEILFYKKDRVVDWKTPELERSIPPDAIYSLGKWIKGEGVVPRK